MDEEQLAREERAHSLCELAAQITELTGHLNAANHRWLTLVAEFDRRKGWADNATASCAHWLNWKCGIALGAAREKVRVANALEALPKISAAMAQGQLSYSKVRELTRVACSGNEDYFLSIALHGTAHHVETLVRHYRHAQQAEELSREARQQSNRMLSYYFDDDGLLVVKARLPAESGALLLKALDAAMEEIHSACSGAEPVEGESDVPAGTSNVKSPMSARRADALGLIAESFVQHGVEAMSGGDRHQIVIHVDAETLRTGCAGRCEFEEGPSMPAQTARRLACDASTVTLIENDQGEPLSIGRKTRSIPPAIRRALNARDQGCRFPGCCNKRFVDGHHIQHWAHGGETKMSNLVTLCRFHHRQVHEGNVLIQILDDGAFRFLKPDGQSFDGIAPGHTRIFSDHTQLPILNLDQGVQIDNHTAVTRWAGESIDYGLGIEVLLQQAQRAKNVSVGAC